ncbi:MAG: hypothetical protein JXO51_00600 [Candidatus Aminicenantes bacterium]|nr:hypothetical protein [Candidatus Aminicenantes bacterium]
MNSERDDLREMWLEESAGAVRPPEAPPPGATTGRSETVRLRSRARLDGWLKTSLLLVLGAALPLFAGRMNAAAWGAIGCSLLGVILGIVQLAWSSKWRAPGPPCPLAQGLAADLETWRRRRPFLALLLGATPALAFQIYLLAYLALNPASSGRLANLLLLAAGGPLLWLLASWRQWARLEAWLLQLQHALGSFDEETAARLERASRRTRLRTAIIVGLVLALLFAGAALFYLTQRT